MPMTTTFKPNRKRNVSVAKRLGNAVSFRVSAEGPVAGVSTKYLEEPIRYNTVE